MTDDRGEAPPGSRERLVLVAFHEQEAGGATTAVLRVVPAMERRGWSFSFWAPGPGPILSELRERGYPVAGHERLLRYSAAALRRPPGPARRLASVPGYARAYRAWVRSQSPSVVHANTRLAIPEAVAARGADRAIVLHVHEVFRGGPRSRAAAGLLRSAVDVVVAPSTAVATGLTRLGVRSEVVPYGVALPPLDGPRPDRPGRIVVGTLGTVSRRKGTDLFVAAARRLRADPSLGPMEFRVAGPHADDCDDRWAHDLIAAAERDGVATHLVAADPFQELADWDIFVLPTREDPFPLAVLEAMASRLPVVATRVDGVAEQVDSAGVLVPPDDVDALVSAIADLARSPTRRELLAASARDRVAEEFTFERQAAGLERAYLAAIAARYARSHSAGRR